MTPWTVAHQTPLSRDFPGKKTGVGCISFSMGSSRPRDQTTISCTAGGFFTAEPSGKPGELSIKNKIKHIHFWEEIKFSLYSNIMSIYRNLQKAMRINSWVKQDTVHNNLQGQQMWSSFERTQTEDAAWSSQAYPNRRVLHDVCHKNRSCQMLCHLQKSEYVYRVGGKKYALKCTREEELAFWYLHKKGPTAQLQQHLSIKSMYFFF